VVSYPFHPLAGQSVFVLGDKDHAGMRHLLVRRSDEAKILLPEWMTFPHAGTIRILPYPRLCVNRLVELRALLDRLMASSAGKLPGGGERNEAIEVVTTGFVQDVTALRDSVCAAKNGRGTAQDAAGGGNHAVDRCAESKRKQRQSGAR
jgi:hypothetical protein